MPDVTFITFNYGNAGRYANGPGICLSNFVKDLRKQGVSVDVFSMMPSWDNSVKPLDSPQLTSSIKYSKAVHHWSGMFPQFSYILNNSKGIKTFVGPNVLDGEDQEKEKEFLARISPSKIFVVNKRIQFELQKKYNLPNTSLDTLIVGPDQELWSPLNKDNGKILWKGNCTHKIKDINFALAVSKALPQYDFKFIGYPNPYDYLKHIPEAKECHLYFTTSVSETMGLALCESWASGLPSVSHPRIEIMGENYSTGIITNKTIEEYVKAITQIMEDNNLYLHLKSGAQEFVKKNFSNTAKDYIEKYL